MNKIAYLTEWTIQDGKLDEFKSLAKDFNGAVSNEPGTVG